MPMGIMRITHFRTCMIRSLISTTLLMTGLSSSSSTTMAIPNSSALVTIPRILSSASAVKGLENASAAISVSTATRDSLPGSSIRVPAASRVTLASGG